VEDVELLGFVVTAVVVIFAAFRGRPLAEQGDDAYMAYERRGSDVAVFPTALPSADVTSDRPNPTPHGRRICQPTPTRRRTSGQTRPRNRPAGRRRH
jgi:hypothetical protein